MTNKTLEDFGRRDLSFSTSKVVEVLPEYFREDNANLVNLLDAYMDYMDSDGGVNDKFRNILKAKDIGSVSLDFLDFILDETGLGLNHDQFTDPRVVTRNFPDFYRYKGSLFSVKSFFRSIYGEEVEVSYPKDQLFIVGESHIGPESLKFIQNGKLYQVLSILIKSSQPISQWKDLYKQMVHPAGFFIGGEVLAEGEVNLSLSTMPTAVLDSDTGLIVEGEATQGLSAVLEPMTAFIQSPDSDTLYRISLEKNLVGADSVSLSDIDGQYTSIFEAGKANPFNYSDSSDSAGIDMSNTLEGVDQSSFDSLGI
jgi:hypothetical protein